MDLVNVSVPSFPSSLAILFLSNQQSLLASERLTNLLQIGFCEWKHTSSGTFKTVGGGSQKLKPQEIVHCFICSRLRWLPHWNFLFSDFRLSAISRDVCLILYSSAGTSEYSIQIVIARILGRFWRKYVTLNALLKLLCFTVGIETVTLF